MMLLLPLQMSNCSSARGDALSRPEVRLGDERLRYSGAESFGKV